MAGLGSPQKFWLRSLALVICLATGFAILEIGARLTGLVLAAPSDKRNQIFPEDASRLRILTIGESTTADFFSGATRAAWPRLLEAKLRERGVSARVYNEGRGGTSSPMIAFRLPAYLEKYRPHIVVSMMGVNDGPALLFSGYEQSWWARTIANLRIVKMAQWAWDRVERIGLCEIDYTEFDSGLYAGVLDKGYELASLGHSLPEVESEVIRLAKTNDPRILALTLTEIASRLNQPHAPGRGQSRGVAYASRAFDIYPLSNKIASVQFVNLADQARGLEVSRKLLACGKNLPDNLLMQVSHYASEDETVTSVFKARNLLLLKSSHQNPTRQHYREIHRLLKEAGISLIAMQYPTLPVEKLKLIFRGEKGEVDPSASDIVFVSNQANFERLLRMKKYEEVFTDRFSGSWGHTTDLGHDAIAHSALLAVLKLMEKREDLKPALSSLKE